MPQTASTRWCPTPEQLMILEQMYRSGVRMPNAAEIQQITAHLAYYGPIEGKNVFYWFQNHKARERQRLRRRLCARHQMQFAAAGAPPSSAASGSGGAAGVHHPPAMHPSYATANFIMPQPHHLQQAAALPVVHHHPAAGGGRGGAALHGSNSSPQEEWTMEELNSSASPGSSDDGTMLPRPSQNLGPLPHQEQRAGGLKDECSSSKSSSCSTSTN